MKEQIKLLTEAFRLNKPVYYNKRYVMAVYPPVNYKNKTVKIRCTDLEPQFVNVFKLEVKDA